MNSFKNQLRQVLRRLARAPIFTAITLITLAAGVGANTVVFSVLEGVLLKPLPYPHSEQLVGVWHTAPGINIPELNMSPSNYFIYREQGQTFQDIGMYQGDSVNVTGIGEPEQVPALRVTEATLPLLGAQPIAGRIFRHEDDLPGAPDTVLLTYGYWRRKFAGASGAIGQMLVVDGKDRQIIGVLPKGFHFLDQTDAALIMPFQFDRNTGFSWVRSAWCSSLPAQTLRTCCSSGRKDEGKSWPCELHWVPDGGASRVSYYWKA